MHMEEMNSDDRLTSMAMWWNVNKRIGPKDQCYCNRKENLSAALFFLFLEGSFFFGNLLIKTLCAVGSCLGLDEKQTQNKKRAVAKTWRKNARSKKQRRDSTLQTKS